MTNNEHKYTITIYFEGNATPAVIRISSTPILGVRGELDVEEFFSQIMGARDTAIHLTDVVDGSLTAISFSHVTHLRVERVAE